MATIASFRHLVAWKKALALAEAAYGLAAKLPQREQFELAAQIRRAAASVPASVAEGHNRHARGAFANHVAIAPGSLAELESHIELALRLGLVERVQAEPLFEQAAEVNRKPHALVRALKESSRSRES